MAKRWGIVDPHTADSTVSVSGETVEFRAHAAYTDSKAIAQEVAGQIRGIVVEREEPSFTQKGAYAITITRCRACDEGICELRSHR